MRIKNLSIILALILLLMHSSLFGQQDLKTEYVFWITYDGLRWQEVFGGVDKKLMDNEDFTSAKEEIEARFWDEDPLESRKKLLPFFWEVILKEGQLYGNRNLGSKVNCSNDQLFSYPGYNEILTGFPDSEINSNDKKYNKNITLLEFANMQEAFKGKVAAFGSWDVFPFIINEPRSGITVNAGFDIAEEANLSDKELLLNEIQPQTPSPWSTVRLDVFTHHYAKEYLRKFEPRLLYIAYGETDDFAHGGDYDAYLKSAWQTDAFIRELWNYAQSHPKYRGKTSLVISTDHGRGTVPIDAWKSHGNKIEGAEEIWIAVLGPDTPALGEVKEGPILYQKQLAQTVAHLLGIQYKSNKPSGEKIKRAFK
ncbi:MAG: phosphoglyceromutase [Bacteroidia bacterium]|nr:phosphoglyceromutase [Bacteroidia bacterium]